MTAGVQVHKLKEIIAAIKQFGEEAAGPAVQKGLKDGALWVREMARANLINHIETGRLYDGLHVEMRTNKSTRMVKGTLSTSQDAFYGWFLEVGTVHQRGVHWMQKAGDSAGPRVVDEVRHSLLETLHHMRHV